MPIPESSNLEQLQYSIVDKNNNTTTIEFPSLAYTPITEKDIAVQGGANIFVSGSVFFFENTYGGVITVEDIKKKKIYEFVNIASTYNVLIAELIESIKKTIIP